MMPKSKLVPEGGRQTKPCEKRGCQELLSTPHCFLQLSPRCKRGGMTSRWHHISAGEHYCNECFDWIYRGHYPGHQLYLQWTEVWSADANTLPNVKTFITDQHLPYWVQCHKSGCGKWRRLPLELELFHVQLDSIQCQDCSLPEDESVAPVLSPYWITTLGYTPLLRHTLLAPLVGEYYPEGVGVSPSTVRYTCRKMAEGQKKKEEQKHGDIPTSISSSQSGNESQHIVEGSTPMSATPSDNLMIPQSSVQSCVPEEPTESVLSPKPELLPTSTSPVSTKWLQNWSQTQDKALNRLLTILSDTSMSLTAGQPPENALIIIKSFQKQLENLRVKTLCVCQLMEKLGVPAESGSALEILKSSTILLQQIIQSTSNPLALQKSLVDQLQCALALNVTLQKQSLTCPTNILASVPPPLPLPLPLPVKSISSPSAGGSTSEDRSSLCDSSLPLAGSWLGTDKGSGTPSSLLMHLLTRGSGSSGQHIDDGSTAPPLKKAKLDSADRASDTAMARSMLDSTPLQPTPVASAVSLVEAASSKNRPSLTDAMSMVISSSVMDPSVMTSPPSMESVRLPDPVNPNHTAHLGDPSPASVSPPLVSNGSPPGGFHLLTVDSSSPKLHTSLMALHSRQPLEGTAPTGGVLPAQRVVPSITTTVALQGTGAASCSVPAFSSPSNFGVGVSQSVGGSVGRTLPAPDLNRVIVKPPDMQCVSLPAVRKSPSVLQRSLLHDPFHPFNDPDDGERAMAFTPDVMTEEEMTAFVDYSKSPVLEVFLMLRNLVLALWHRNCKSYLSVEQCFEELNVRGLVRIWCLGAIQRIVHFLTRRGYINYGYLDNTAVPFPIAGTVKPCHVLVIGAGPAGIGCAKHLQQFGYQVTVLEAKASAGGRCHDDSSLGATLSLGAMIVTGIDNNPITTLCHQMGFPLHLIVDDKCDLISESGKKPSLEMDKKIDDHFNTCLDRLAEWRLKDGEDCSLENKLLQLSQELQTSRGYTLTEEEEHLLHFHFSNLEFACGAELCQVSARNWDHNDKFPQFNGPHATLPQGYQVLFQRLADQLHVNYLTPVKRVEVTEGAESESCHVTDSHGMVWTADKVVVTVPLAVLKSGDVQFHPPLPKRKVDALHRLGVGVIEKIIVQFPSPFWRQKMNTPHFFGHVSRSVLHRGLFPVFYDVTEKPSDTAGPFILLSTVCGAAVRLLDSLTDGELVDLFVSTLRTLFPDLDVPSPLGHVVSHWRADPLAHMSYSYAAVGSSGEDYQIMAEDCYQKLYFAGEGTNELYPQTVTGAYLSGIREACKIIESK